MSTDERSDLRFSSFRALLLPLTVLVLTLSIGGVVAIGRAAPAATPPPSGFLPIYQTGAGWPAEAYATGIAFGDVDGDGLDEIAFVRTIPSGPRVLLVDDAAAGHALLWTAGADWDPAAQPLSVALGDVDGDGLMEIAVGRAAPDGSRVFIYDDAQAGFAPLWDTGADWAAGVGATGVAFGNVDGDPAFEFGAITDAIAGPRVFVHDDSGTDYAPLWQAGADWGAGGKGTGIAFGDVDGDGLAEVGFTRISRLNDRVYLHNGADGTLLWTYGENWGDGAWATGIAFGNVDDDSAQEIGVARLNSVNEQAYVFDDAAAGFAILATFGETWNPAAYATAIAFGDVDGDERDEVGLTRFVTINARFFIHDDAIAGFALIGSGGESPEGEDYATAIAFGRVDRAPEGVFGVAYSTDDGPRISIYRRGWTLRLPVVVWMEEEVEP
jgi:hypothetical protein